MNTNSDQPHALPASDPAVPSRRRWRRERWDEPATIYFFSGHGGEFEAFSNFAPTPFAMPAWHDPSQIVHFATGEHAFQAAKASTAEDHDRIRLAASPLAAKRAGRRLPLPADWNHRRAHVMLAVVRAKFAVPELAGLLLGTGDRLLAEDSPYDPVWGCRDRSGGYTGQNLLGRALMRVRDELAHATHQPDDAQHNHANPLTHPQDLSVTLSPVGPSPRDPHLDRVLNDTKGVPS